MAKDGMMAATKAPLPPVPFFKGPQLQGAVSATVPACCHVCCVVVLQCVCARGEPAWRGCCW
jgi:hypothetical protein